MANAVVNRSLPRQRPKRRVHRYNYRDGPMGWLAQQIVRRMNDIGWDAVIFELYRTPEQQKRYFEAGTSKAPPWTSAHQYWCAVDIVLRTDVKRYHWPPRSHKFWRDLAAVVRTVEETFGVPLVHGHVDWGWDSAHIELENFRVYRAQFLRREMSQEEKDGMFEEVLPVVWKAYQKSKAYQTRV